MSFILVVSIIVLNVVTTLLTVSVESERWERKLCGEEDRRGEQGAEKTGDERKM